MVVQFTLLYIELIGPTVHYAKLHRWIEMAKSNPDILEETRLASKYTFAEGILKGRLFHLILIDGGQRGSNPNPEEGLTAEITTTYNDVGNVHLVMDAITMDATPWMARCWHEIAAVKDELNLYRYYLDLDPSRCY
ncbi:hypothetical protein YC2023_116379 [Brassica napus]